MENKCFFNAESLGMPQVTEEHVHENLVFEVEDLAKELRVNGLEVSLYHGDIPADR